MKSRYALPLAPVLMALGIGTFLALSAPGVKAQEPVQPAPAQASPAPTATLEDPEIARLRRLIGAKSDATIEPAAIPKLTADFPIKVFISTGLEMKARENYTRWIGEWQKKDAKKYGELEIVSDASQADVILVRYTILEAATASVRTSSYPVSNKATVYSTNEYGTSVPSGKIVTSSTQTVTSSSTVVPVLSYVVERKPDGFKIVNRSQAVDYVNEGNDTGKPLWKDFEKMLKEKGDQDRKSRAKK